MSTTVFPLVYMFGGGFPKLHILSKDGRSKPPPVLTSGFNRL